MFHVVRYQQSLKGIPARSEVQLQLHPPAQHAVLVRMWGFEQSTMEFKSGVDPSLLN